MFSNFKKIPTSDLNDYVRQLREYSADGVKCVSFPCGAELRGSNSLRSVLISTCNANETPATLRCGDKLRERESAVCRYCFTKYDHQINGEVESIPLRGSIEDEEAEREVDKAHSDNKLVSFAKKHPYLTTGIGILFAAGTIGTALGAYKAYSELSTVADLSRMDPSMMTTAAAPFSANSSTVDSLMTTAPLTTNSSIADSSTATAPSTTTELKTTPSKTTMAEPKTTPSKTTTAELKTTPSKTTTAEPKTTSSKTTTAEPKTTPPATTTQPKTSQSTTVKLTTTELVTTQAANQTTTQAKVTQEAATKPTPVTSTRVKIYNHQSTTVEAFFEVCDPVCSSVGVGVTSRQPQTVSFDVKDSFKSASIRYSFPSKETSEEQLLKSSLDNTTFPNGKVLLAKKETINSLDKNRDGKLEIRHTVLNFEGANRVDQVFEDEDGMPKYASVTTDEMKLVLDNRWYGKAYFALNAKGAESTFPYRNVRVWNYEERNFPLGIHELDIQTESYTQKRFTGQDLNKALAGSKKQTVCITADRYASPSYLSNIKHGRCGR